MSAPTNPFAGVIGKYISVVTFRKSGAAVATPIWFTQENGRLYGYSTADAGKVKRIRATGRVQVAPCDMRGTPTGPYIEAVGRMLPPAEGARVSAALTRKYGWTKRLMDLFAQFRPTKRVYFEIAPAEGAVK